MLQKVEFRRRFPERCRRTEVISSAGFLLGIVQAPLGLFLFSVRFDRWPWASAAALLWPATYLSEGKILVQSQQIPSELVRPTVTSAAQERIQVIQQRTMTRDNLIAIADKIQVVPGQANADVADRTRGIGQEEHKIAPVDLQLDFKQRTRAAMENPTIVFSVGFEYADPATAARVANELMTRILNEDLRDRTSRATDTTKFLSREVQRLQAENTALDNKIAQLRVSQGKPAASARADQPTTLDQLKSELVQKSALYSDRHPRSSP